MEHNLIILCGKGYAYASAQPQLIVRLEELQGMAVSPVSAGAKAVILGEMERRVALWDGIAVLVQVDAQTGAWMLIALHDATRGLTAGGCRMQIYPDHACALTDAMRLAEAMTSKWAVIGFNYGGGKAVLSVPRTLSPLERQGLLQRFGQLLETLAGIYQTGEDLGTNADDIAVLAQVTEYASGFDRVTRRAVNSGYYTALGVKFGIEAAVKFVYGRPQLSGRTALIQGVGGVGAALARLLSEAGAIVYLSDIDAQPARMLGAELGCEILAPAEVRTFPCDVYAPCAVGGTLDRAAAETLRCRIVAGAANNQLSEDSVAELLKQRNIFYVPDFVLNAGGAIALTMFHRGASEVEVRTSVAGIAATLGEIFIEADRAHVSPWHAAGQRVERTLRRTRLSKPDGLAVSRG